MAGIGKFADVLARAHASSAPRSRRPACPSLHRSCTFERNTCQSTGFRSQSADSLFVYRPPVTPRRAQAESWRQATALHVTDTPDARTWHFRTRERTYMSNNFIDTPRTAK
jgi:hypothetical protein